MARRELKTWHYRATTALAVITLLCVIAFFAQTFRSFFLTDQDPVLVAVERIKQKVEERAEQKSEQKAQQEAEQPQP